VSIEQASASVSVCVNDAPGTAPRTGAGKHDVGVFFSAIRDQRHAGWKSSLMLALEA